MDTTHFIENASSSQITPAQSDSQQTPEHKHEHPLTEVQRRAVTIHQRHGGVYGGYTLEDWLEAEHELDDQDNSQPAQNDRIH
jgi:hypothetical protein